MVLVFPKKLQLTFIPALFAPENMIARHNHITDIVWLQSVKLNPIRHRPVPNWETNANDLRIILIDAISLLDKKSASHAVGNENNIARRWGRADKNPIWNNELVIQIFEL